MVLICSANLGGAAVLKRNGNCSGGGPIIKQGPTLRCKGSTATAANAPVTAVGGYHAE